MPEQEAIYTCDPSQIIVPEKRQRRGSDPTKQKQLMESIQKLGQLQAGVCRKDGNDIVLVAGFRRLTACRTLGIAYHYTLKEEIIDPVVREEMELHENLMRENLSFLDEAAARSDLHKLYMETRGTGTIKGQPTWSIQKTAGELNISAATLHNDIELNGYAEKIPAVRDAKNKSEANKIVKRLKNQVLQQEALRQLQIKETPEKLTTAAQILSPQTSVEKLQAIQDSLAVAADGFAKHCHTGDFHEILPSIAEPESFDVVFFDPPWGVDFQDGFALSGSQQGYADKRRDFFKNLSGHLQLIYDYMKPHSHLYFKFGIVHHFWVVRTLLKIGFKTSGIPIMWHKQGSHRTRSPEHSFGRSYEPILFAKKGSKVLRRPGHPDLISTPTPTTKMKGIHPSTMHPLLPRTLLECSCFPGDKVLDPMAGSGMTGVAAESLRKELQLSYTLIDLDPAYHGFQIQNLLRGYDTIYDKIAEPESIGTDYKSIKPGSPEWIKIWTENPDLHEEMMEWTKEKS